MLTVTYMQLTTMNAWKLATDVHHLDMHNKAPFTFDLQNVIWFSRLLAVMAS